MRCRNPLIVLGSDGRPLAGAKVHTTIRSSGSDASVYANETGGTAGTNPATTDAQGRVVQWLDRGAYTSTITAEGMEPYAEPWDSAPAADGAVDPGWLSGELEDGAAGVSTTRKLGPGSDEAAPGCALQGFADILQAGVVASTDWSLTATINAGTGELGSEANTGGIAWLPDPAVSGALLRCVQSPIKLKELKPPSLPASGKYMAVCFELIPSTWGEGVNSVALHSGASKASQAEAEAAPPATTAGRLQVLQVVIKNTGGVYSIVGQTDIRVLAANETTRSAKSIIATEQSREATTFGTLATPDEVTVTLPGSSLIAVAYQAVWKESVAEAARAALFIGANQLKIASAGGGGPFTQSAATGTSAANVLRSLAMTAGGLVSGPGTGVGEDVTTGQLIGLVSQAEKSLIMELGGGGTPAGIGAGASTGAGGGVITTAFVAAGVAYVFAAAGTYKVSVQFKASSGKVTAKNRKLWVWVVA